MSLTRANVPDNDELNNADRKTLERYAQNIPNYEADVENTSTNSLKYALRSYRKGGRAISCGNCGKSWVYYGDNPWYVSCPRCHSTITSPFKDERPNASEQG